MRKDKLVMDKVRKDKEKQEKAERDIGEEIKNFSIPTDMYGKSQVKVETITYIIKEGI